MKIHCNIFTQITPLASDVPVIPICKLSVWLQPRHTMWYFLGSLAAFLFPLQRKSHGNCIIDGGLEYVAHVLSEIDPKDIL